MHLNVLRQQDAMIMYGEIAAALLKPSRASMEGHSCMVTEMITMTGLLQHEEC